MCLHARDFAAGRAADCAAAVPLLLLELELGRCFTLLYFCGAGAGAGAVVLPRPLVFSVSSGVLTCLLVRLMVRLLVHLSWFWCHAAGTNAGICCCYPLMPPLVGSRADVGMLLG